MVSKINNLKKKFQRPLRNHSALLFLFRKSFKKVSYINISTFEANNAVELPQITFFKKILEHRRMASCLVNSKYYYYQGGAPGPNHLSLYNEHYRKKIKSRY